LAVVLIKINLNKCKKDIDGSLRQLAVVKNRKFKLKLVGGS
jgi:hypothetical protein